MRFDFGQVWSKALSWCVPAKVASNVLDELLTAAGAEKPLSGKEKWMRKLLEDFRLRTKIGEDVLQMYEGVLLLVSASRGSLTRRIAGHLYITYNTVSFLTSDCSFVLAAPLGGLIRTDLTEGDTGEVLTKGHTQHREHAYPVLNLDFLDGNSWYVGEVSDPSAACQFIGRLAQLRRRTYANYIDSPTCLEWHMNYLMKCCMI